MKCTYKRNSDVRSRNHCYSGKTINIIYSECVFIALGIQHALSMRHILIYDLSGSVIFSRITGTICGGKGWGHLSNIKCVF